jgi:hypothetical protein
MLRRVSALPALLACAFFSAAPLSAQSIEDVLGRYSGDNAEGFLQPLADVLGASMSSGWARSADIRPGFHLKLTAIAAAAPISDDSRFFQGTTENFSPQTTAQVPTILGPTDFVEVPGAGGTSYVFPGGIDASMLGTVAPQLTIGTVAGTEAMIRWFSVDIDEDFGSVSLLGLGGRHDIDQYLGNLPVELAAGVYWQRFEIGDVVSSSTLSFMGHVSRGFGVLTLYGGAGYETSSTDITYARAGETAIDVSLDGNNSIRLNGGVQLQLFILGVFADYTLASQNTFTLGVELGR